MSTAAANAITPERTDPAAEMANTMLDLCEGQIEALVAAGLEAPLRARLARLLPPPAAAPAQAAAPQVAAFTDIDRAIRFANAVENLASHARRGKSGSAQALRDANDAAFLRSELDALRHRAGAAA